MIDEDERSEKVGGGGVDEVHAALAPSSPAHSSPAHLINPQGQRGYAARQAYVCCEKSIF